MANTVIHKYNNWSCKIKGFKSFTGVNNSVWFTGLVVCCFHKRWCFSFAFIVTRIYFTYSFITVTSHCLYCDVFVGNPGSIWHDAESQTARILWWADCWMHWMVGHCVFNWTWVFPNQQYVYPCKQTHELILMRLYMVVVYDVKEDDTLSKYFNGRKWVMRDFSFSLRLFKACHPTWVKTDKVLKIQRSFSESW